jgi:hypothetical protein
MLLNYMACEATYIASAVRLWRTLRDSQDCPKNITVPRHAVVDMTKDIKLKRRKERKERKQAARRQSYSSLQVTCRLRAVRNVAM